MDRPEEVSALLAKEHTGLGQTEFARVIIFLYHDHWETLLLNPGHDELADRETLASCHESVAVWRELLVHIAEQVGRSRASTSMNGQIFLQTRCERVFAKIIVEHSANHASLSIRYRVKDIH